MAIAFNPLTSGADTTDAISFTTASITPGANRLILLVVQVASTNPAPTPTVTGNGLTWVEVVGREGEP